MKNFLSLLLILQLLLCPAEGFAFFFGGVTIKDEKEMGHKFNVMVRASLPVIGDPEISHYINDILKRLVKGAPPQPFEFTSTVILHNALNAFAVPGGYVYVFSGMVMNLDSEDELAGVLSHELAHVTLRHVASRLERAQYLTVGSLLLAIAGVVAGGPGGGAIAMGAFGAGQTAMLNYSRIDESEADNIGLQYLIAAGYPARGMVGGFKVLRQKSWMSGTSVPTYLSTHPAISERIDNLLAKIKTMQGSIQNRHLDNSRFQRVKTLLWARYGDEQAALQKFSGNSALSLMGRGIVLARKNRINEAAQAFDTALSIAPQEYLVQREAGIFHFRKGDLQRAHQHLTKALQINKNDFMASFFYARLLDETGKTQQSLNHYTHVLKDVPDDSEVHEAYAKALGKIGKTFDAYVHMAYSAIYANNRKLAEQYYKRAQNFSGNAANKSKMNQLDNIYKERKEIWDKS